jgi:hypothetical protein
MPAPAPQFETRTHAADSLALLQKTALPRLNAGTWPCLQETRRRRGARWRPEEMRRDFDELFDRLWDIVEQVRSIVTLDREIGLHAEEAVRSNATFREIWQAIKDSGLFPPDDDRFAAVELFLLAGAFPYEDDAFEDVCEG